MAEGTWVLDNDRQAFPLQTTQIRCERELKRCTGATATVMSGNMLSTDISFFEVVAWDAGRVVFRDDTPICVSYLYTIDLASKSANAVRTKKSGAPEGTCGSIAPEMRMSLQEGWPISLKMQQDATPWFGKLAVWPFTLFR